MISLSTLEQTGLFVVAIIGTIALGVFLWKLLSPEEEKSSIIDVETRAIKATSSFAELDPESSLFDRFCLFVLTSLRLETSLERTWTLMGNPENEKPVKILKNKIIYSLALGILFGLVFKSLFFGALFLVVGFTLPDMMLKQKIQKRQQDILGNFSTTVDLAALIIESGLDYMTAFDRIIRIAKEKTVLEEEIGKMLNEVKLGYSRREALERMSARTGVQEMRSLVGLIIQSDELGTSLVELLRDFSVDLRFRRLTKAEQLAAQASTKMLIPLFVFIFPTVFILMLSPMIKDLISSGGLGF